MCKKLMFLASFVVLLAMANSISAVELKVDIGADDQTVKAGWTEWSEPRLDPGPPSAQKSFGDVTVTLTQTGGDGLGFRNGDEPCGDLTGDGVHNDNVPVGGSGAIIMTISGLAAGDYIITTYHNDIFTGSPTIDIKVNGALKFKDFALTQGAPDDDSAANATYDFTASGGDVVIEFIGQTGMGHVLLSAFYLRDAMPTIEFGSADSGGMENVSPAMLPVSLRYPKAGETYTVDYAVTGGTATGGGVDYLIAGAGPACWGSPTQCHGDTDNDGDVKGSDFLALKGAWYKCDPEPGYDACADFDRDGCVKGSDFLILKSNWYKTVDANCPPEGGSTTLEFAPGETSKTININIIDDGLPEGDETIIVGLSNPTGLDVELGAITKHTYTISDSPPEVSFGMETSSGQEYITGVEIAVNLSHASDETVMVDYRVTGGTATGGGVDYTLADGTLTFNPGQVSQQISIDIVDDTITEADETIILTLFNPTNAGLGAITQHTYTIYNDEMGVAWDGLTWYYTEYVGGPFVNELGQLEWDPEKGGQFVTRIPTQDFSKTGDKAEVTYWWLTDGATPCDDVDDCYDCPRCTGDIRCISGTSDFRAGLFEADGEYIDHDVYSVRNDIFVGYKGYNFRFGPNMRAEPTRWVDCDGEVHKTGSFAKKSASSTNLMTRNEGLMDYIPGFELTPGEWSLWKISIERLSSSRVRLSITLNGRTYTDTDDDSDDQPQKIDVFGIHMRNGRNYNRLVLDTVQ